MAKGTNFCILLVLFGLVYGQYPFVCTDNELALSTASGLNVTVFGNFLQGFLQNNFVCNNDLVGFSYTFVPFPNAHVVVSACNTYNMIPLSFASGNATDFTCDDVDLQFCSQSNDECSLTSTSNKLEWTANGSRYFLVVGIPENSNLGSFEFEIAVSGGTPLSCTNSIPIQGPFIEEVTMFGSIGLSPDLENITICNFTTNNPVQWYTIKTQPGDEIRVSICDGHTAPLFLSVLSDCDTCTDGQTNYCGSGMEFIFTPALSSYYIAVGGQDSEFGDYILTVVETSPPVSGCRQAYPVYLAPNAPLSLQGSTEWAFGTNMSVCDYSGPAVWYLMTFGDSGTVQCNTCSGSMTDAAILVLSGDCNDLDCVTSDEHSCSSGTRSKVQFDAGAQKQNYVLVMSDNLSGSYTLSCSFVE